MLFINLTEYIASFYRPAISSSIDENKGCYGVPQLLPRFHVCHIPWHPKLLGYSLTESALPLPICRPTHFMKRNFVFDAVSLMSWRSSPRSLDLLLSHRLVLLYALLRANLYVSQVFILSFGLQLCVKRFYAFAMLRTHHSVTILIFRAVLVAQ